MNKYFVTKLYYTKTIFFISVLSHPKTTTITGEELRFVNGTRNVFSLSIYVTS
jgi:hypothetical protein